MAGGVSYQLINDTGSHLNLVETFPTTGLTMPTTLPIGAQSSVTNQTGELIAFGYEIDGYTAQFWIISNPNSSGPEVGQLSPGGHSIDANVSGNSEDGYVIALTFQ